MSISFSKSTIEFKDHMINENPVGYGKARVSGSTNVSYFLHCRGANMPGQEELFSIGSHQRSKDGESVAENRKNSAYKRERFRESKERVFNNGTNLTYEKYHPYDDESFEIAVSASYRQVFGNLYPMESEKPKDLERLLRNGDLSIREFIRGIAKSEFYRINYVNKMSNLILIELSFMHLLGRPLIDSNELNEHINIIQTEGYEAHIDSLIDSIEYEINFGSYIVPYNRCWKSPSGMKTSTFIKFSKLANGISSSDNSTPKDICFSAISQYNNKY